MECDPRDAFMRDLDLPRGVDREIVRDRDHSGAPADPRLGYRGVNDPGRARFGPRARFEGTVPGVGCHVPYSAQKWPRLVAEIWFPDGPRLARRSVR